MTAAAREAPAGVAVVSSGLSRSRLYGGLFLLAMLNAASGAAIDAIGDLGFVGAALALVCWAVVTQYFEVPFDRRSILTAVAAVLATMAVNMARIGGILVSPEWARIIHDGWGATVSMWLTLALVIGICVFGGRREVLARG